jgi:hypothetical protein
MSNSFQNTKLGNVPFVTFYMSVLSRLAYFSSVNFLQAYEKQIGIDGGISKELMSDLNAAEPIDIFNDNKIFKLSSKENKYPVYEHPITCKQKDSKKLIIDIKSIAIKVNEVNRLEVVKYKEYVKSKENKVAIPKLNTTVGEGSTRPTNVMQVTPKRTVAYINIATSNYAGYYILVDTLMPNSIFVIFRGTYSQKAARSYMQLSSIFPHEIGKDMSSTERKEALKNDEGTKYGTLKGVDKILKDVLHTIIESMLYLSQKYLKNEDNSIKVFTAGHSLGGGLTTLFAHKWKDITSTPPYNAKPYNIFKKKIICVSLAAPRVMSDALSNNFCKRTKTGDIMFKRIAVAGDPVTGMPWKNPLPTFSGFHHPCSHKATSNISQRKKILMSCASTLKKKEKTVDYNMSSDCKKENQTNASTSVMHHLEYLYVNFANVVNVAEFMKSALPMKSFFNGNKYTVDLSQKDNKTMCRIILATTNESSIFNFQHIFFKLGQLRVDDSKDNRGKEKTVVVTADRKSTTKVFQHIVENMKLLTGDLNPLYIEDVNMLIIEDELLNMNENDYKPTIDGLVKDDLNSLKKGGRLSKKKRRKKTCSKTKKHKKSF